VAAKLIAAACAFVAGAFYGYQHTFDVVMEWRMAHPLSLVPSVALAVWLVVRWRRA